MSDPVDMPALWRVATVSDMHGLEAVGRRQFGLVSRAQAVEKGLSPEGIRWRLERGEWECFRQGVYRFRASPVTWSQHAMGALLQAGAGCALSHQTAAFLFGLDGFSRAPPAIVDVTTIGNRDLIAPRVRFHRTRDETLPTELVRGLTTTSLPRTLVDLAPLLKPAALEIALDSARRSRSMLPVQLKKYLATLTKRASLPLLKELLALRQSPLDSPKEVELLREVERRGLPRPIPGYSVFDLDRFIMKVDLAWVTQKAALHFDSYRYHHHRERFERDARQRSLLAAAGWRSIIVTAQSLRSTVWSDALKRLLLPEQSPAHR